MSRTTESRLYVEGHNDREFVYHLCNSREIDNQQWFETHASDSYSQVRGALKQDSKPGGRLRRLGAIVDADVDPNGRWDSLVEALAGNGYTLPGSPPGEPVIVDGPTADHPRIGLWMMPDNILPGMLEDFALRLVRDEDPLLPRARAAAEAVMRDLPPDVRFKNVHLAKAQIHTWLAWQDEPGRPLGQALKFKMLDADHQLANRLATWLRQLFVEG